MAEIYLAVTLKPDAQGEPQLQFSPLVKKPDVAQFDAELVFELVLDHRLHLCFQTDVFTPDALERLFKESTPLSEPLRLYFSMSVRMVEGQYQANCLRLLNPPTSTEHNLLSVMSFSAYRGRLVKGTLPDLRQIVTAYLYWHPAVPAKNIQDQLRPHIEQCIKQAMDKDSDLKAAVYARIARLPTDNTPDGIWHFLE